MNQSQATNSHESIFRVATLPLMVTRAWSPGLCRMARVPNAPRLYKYGNKSDCWRGKSPTHARARAACCLLKSHFLKLFIRRTSATCNMQRPRDSSLAEIAQVHLASSGNYIDERSRTISPSVPGVGTFRRRTGSFLPSLLFSPKKNGSCRQKPTTLDPAVPQNSLCCPATAAHQPCCPRHHPLEPWKTGRQQMRNRQVERAADCP